MPRMRGAQIESTTTNGTDTLDNKLQAIENAGATDWDLDNDGRVDHAYSLKSPPNTPYPIEWTVDALNRELKRLANRSVGIAAAL